VNAGAVLNWSAGTLLGPLTVAANGALNLVGSGNKFVENALTNAGVITFGGNGDLYLYNNLGIYKGAIYNLSGAVFDIQTDRNLNCGCYGSELFNNAGLLRKSANSGITSIAVPVQNSGSLDVERGTVNFSLNSGYAQTGATMTFGVTATNSAGHVNLAGAVNFDGTIAINPLNGYTPQNGDILSLITYGSRTGIFNNLNLPSLSPGLGWQAVYNATALQLKVVPNGSNTAQIHFVTTATQPAGVANISGAGSYTNGQAALFTAPSTVLSPPYVYTFQKFTLDSVLVSTSNSFNKTFATTDPASLQYVAVYNSSLAPSPDLAVTNVRAPAIVSASQTVQVVWTDANVGNAPATNSWNDQVFLSNTNVSGRRPFPGRFYHNNRPRIRPIAYDHTNRDHPPIRLRHQLVHC